ncbi:MAG TPA: hypothetical protein PLZ53_05300 [Candidatus Hydrogenedentes bacterium]|jgi:hypothetical protein|nr:MAG: hypothetical protein BWY07_00146 [Candidatus Hydrogenedentes bacterium ADurb.Bin170]HNZ49398.1 hypothetical protein [Candidatus Hydrogenedentota bacterium]HOD94798.1 hypothetical protein [Candidatus Hydrogenedentota bacterium]HOH42511.1 hypothetical protein [Candidatus Hydrogenedentota bacterium]HPK24231.1 hypothetical protein [Candidatus Hydrogenedentota bacterium]
MKHYALGIALLFVLPPLLLLSGCGPSSEEKQVMAQFNAMDELIQRGGYIKSLEKFEKRDDRTFSIEAEIVDANGVPLGRLRSERVEGFATAKPRIQWYKTPGEREEWNLPGWGGRRGGQGRGNRPDGAPRGGRGGRPAQDSGKAPAPTGTS